ncbi:hypothetical protein GQ457_06G026420 [Hibiscus cannabinus]
MDERMLKNKRKKTWKCDIGLKTTRDKKVITCSWIMFRNTPSSLMAALVSRKKLNARYGGTYDMVRVPNVQGKAIKYKHKKDNMFEQYQHVLKTENDNFLAWRRKNAITVSEGDKKINQSCGLNSQQEAQVSEQEDRIQGYQIDDIYIEPLASQNEQEMLKEQVEEPKIQVQEYQVKIPILEDIKEKRERLLVHPSPRPNFQVPSSR